MIICPLTDGEIDAGDCLENTDIIDGFISDVSHITDKFKVKPDYKEICKNCKYHESTWGDWNDTIENLRFPVCGQFYFEKCDDNDLCPVCGWFNDKLQKDNPDYLGRNHRTLNEHREQWKNGTLPDYIYDLIEQNKNRLPPK